MLDKVLKSWRHGRKRLGFPRSDTLVSRILAARQETAGLTKTSEFGIQNHGGIARFAEVLPRSKIMAA